MASSTVKEERMNEITSRGNNLGILGKILGRDSLPAKSEKDCPIPFNRWVPPSKSNWILHTQILLDLQ